MSNSHFVQPDSNGGWEIKRSGAKKSSGNFNTKKEAEKVAREISRNQKTELVIKGKDGKIQRKDSHGNDPRNVKG